MINKLIKDAKITRDEWIELIKSLILFWRFLFMLVI
jgi:hypothetical protein